MTSEELKGFSLAYLDNRVSCFRHLVSEGTLAVLNQTALDEKILGVTDTSSLSLLAMLTRLCQPIRFLQLGTHFGYTALVLADIMKHNIRQGHLYTVELNPESHRHARQQAEAASLSDIIDFIDGSSTDWAVIDKVEQNGPYDIVYIDSSHSYGETLKELECYIENKSVVAEKTLAFFHDASEFAKQFDATQCEGVRRALDEWHAVRNKDFNMFIFEPPSWPNACGFGVVTRKPAESAESLSPQEEKSFTSKVKKVLQDESQKAQTEILSVFTAGLPSILMGKTIAIGGKAYIDGLNKKTTDVILNIKNEDGFDINGWAYDDKTNTASKTIFIELMPVKKGVKYYVEARRSEREDVAKFFNSPGLKNAGFNVKAAAKSVPAGKYRINIIQFGDGVSILTSTGSMINKVN
jgi:predicted O-methyltransferase YrrM